ncbi:MAG: bifunctional phosphoribosylaminoimidazolecarboxamide formyltransferase/IMP cyclohydrolase, partial [Candidatus Pacebacteria bacterium]|nr:bifunctional phosphoribosylaminoimidazolecarboxamide formyltransferase/IMP cyclohydrolase [Candidatus Paceibacterota bacterium]
MNTNDTQVKRVLISVSNKTGILEFAKGLHAQGAEIISTGGTAKALAEAGIPVVEISQFTGFPEMMDGRVKTLHPLVHAGILGLRDKHEATATEHNIKWIDLVVVNLYPFSETIQKPDVTDEMAIENIDIGGPTMIRSAAKNVGWVGVVVDPNDYSSILTELASGGLTFETRKRLANKAFGHTAQYDSIIYNYFRKEKFQEDVTLTFKKSYDLRYGENPHQEACV